MDDRGVALDRHRRSVGRPLAPAPGLRRADPTPGRSCRARELGRPRLPRSRSPAKRTLSTGFEKLRTARSLGCRTTFQRRIVPSAPAVTTRSPPGRNVAAATESPCPRSVASDSPFATRHVRAVPSFPAVTTKLPSRAEVDVVDEVLVRGQDAHRLRAADAPHAGRPVGARGGDERRTRAECDVGDVADVAEAKRRPVLSGRDPPEPNRAVSAADGQGSSCRPEAERRDRARLVQHVASLPGERVHDYRSRRSIRDREERSLRAERRVPHRFRGGDRAHQHAGVDVAHRQPLRRQDDAPFHTARHGVHDRNRSTRDRDGSVAPQLEEAARQRRLLELDQIGTEEADLSRRAGEDVTRGSDGERLDWMLGRRGPKQPGREQ